MALGNILVGQSGGPTAVINSSLAGVYETAKALGAPHVYGMQFGIEGLLQGKLVEMDPLFADPMQIELLKRVGLTVPQTTLLLDALNQDGCALPLDALSVDECADALYQKIMQAKA